MRQALVLDLVTTDEESDSEEDPILEPKWKTLKSVTLRMADSSVLHKVVWPHEVVYTVMGKPAEYEDISIPLFISSHGSGKAGPVSSEGPSPT